VVNPERLERDYERARQAIKGAQEAQDRAAFVIARVKERRRGEAQRPRTVLPPARSGDER
jgi:hypothetical protein